MVITNCLRIEIVAFFLLKKKERVDIVKNNGSDSFVSFRRS